MDTTEGMTQPQRKHEAPELGAAAARLIRALAERAGDGDTEALEQLAALERLVPTATQLAGYELHEWGYSHAELANVLGISRQAAVKRFGAVPLSAEFPFSWPMDWFTKRTSSGAVMRQLVGQLVARRSDHTRELRAGGQELSA